VHVGLSAGLSVGLACGVGADDGAAPTGLGYTVDASSAKATPVSAAEWATFIAAKSLTISTPNYLHLCQEASGNMTDTIGGLTLTANGSPAYQQAVSGWTRTGVKGDGVTANQRFRSASAPNPSTTSMALFAFVSLGTQTASVQSVMGVGAIADTTVSAYLNGAPVVGRIRYRESANITDTGTGTDYQARVTPILLLIDHTGTRARLYTDVEKLSPTYGLPSAVTAYCLGADSGTWTPSTILYSCGWTGAAAEAITDAQAKALFEGLGYTIPWI